MTIIEQQTEIVQSWELIAKAVDKLHHLPNDKVDCCLIINDLSKIVVRLNNAVEALEELK